MAAWSISRPAAAGFLAYFLLAAGVGEVWPLSRFPMYSDVPLDSAVPVMLADGVRTEPEALVGFHGCTPTRIRIPRGVRTRMGWRMDGVARWVTSHQAAEPGEVVVAFGYAPIVHPATGPALGEVVVLCEGTARWPR